jgi:hypothetical protein
MVRGHPERSAAESKDPAKLPLSLRNGIPRLALGMTMQRCRKVLFMEPRSATLVNL